MGLAVPSTLVSPPPYLTLPLWATRILAVVLPVWAAWQGQLTIFEVVWVYWVEGWLLLPFLMLRIVASQGPNRNESTFGALTSQTSSNDSAPATLWQRLRLMIGLLIIRGGLLLFYLVFIVAFLLLQVTQRDALEHGVETMAFRNGWANGAWSAFIVAQTIEIVAHFFSNGLWRTASPRRWSSPFDARTILLHISLVGTVMLHKFLFEGTDYASKAEVAYVAFFGLLRLLVEGAAKLFSPLQPRRDGALPAEVG